MDTVQVDETLLRREFFKPPFRGLLLAPSMSGKSTFIKEFISAMHRLILPEHQFAKVKIFYGVWSPFYLELTALHPNISFHDGPPTAEIEQILSDEESNTQTQREPELWILEDLMNEVANTKSKVCDLFTKASHHCQVSCLVTAQRFFSSGSSCSELRTLHSNASFLLIWRSYRNRSSVECLARQIGAYPSGFIASALEQSWSRDRFQPLGLQISNQFSLDDQLRCISVMSQAKPYKLVPVAMFNRLMANQQQRQQVDKTEPKTALDNLRPAKTDSTNPESANIIVTDEREQSTVTDENEYEPLLQLLPKTVRNKARISLKLIWDKLDMDKNSLRLRTKTGELSSHIIDVLYWAFATGIVASKLDRPIEGPEVIRLMHKYGVPTSFYKNRMAYLNESGVGKIGSRRKVRNKDKIKKHDTDKNPIKWLSL